MDANDVGVIIAAVSALVVGMAGVFFRYVSSIAKQDKNERIEILKMNSEALTLLSKSLADNTSSNKEIAAATKRSAAEAKERNGHLAELQLKGQEMFNAIGDRNFKETSKALEAIQLVCEQNKSNKCNK